MKRALIIGDRTATTVSQLLAQAGLDITLRMEGKKMAKRKKNISTAELVAARMKAHEGCEATSVETRQSRRAALRRNGMVKPTSQKNRLKGPRWMRAAKQIAARKGTGK
jgi:hypothetical protein